MPDLHAVKITALPAVRARWRVGLSTRSSRALTASSAVVGLVALASLSSAFHLWPFVVSGVDDGSIYALAALGLVLTYKTSGIFNFAIGAQAAASGYVFYTFRNVAHLPWPVAALFAMALVGLLGSLLLERIAYWLTDAPPVMKVVATIGLLVALQSLLVGVYGQATVEFQAFLPSKGLHIGSVNVLGSQMIDLAIAVATTLGLFVFFKRTRSGVAMQAVVDNPQLLASDGISPTTVRRTAWAIGSCFVSISGMLIAPELGIDVNTMLLLYIAAFGAAALGAFSSLPATFFGAIGIGIAMSIASFKFGSSSDIVVAGLYEQLPFLVVVAALLLIPRSRLIDRGSIRIRRFKPTARLPLPWAVPFGVALVSAGIAVPVIVGAAYVSQYATALSFAVILGSLGLLLWTSGQISLCQMAFAAVGATTFSHAQAAGWPWFLALAAAAVVAIPVGALVAIPSFRLSGIYLAVATFGAGLLFQNLIYRTFLMFGSGSALTVTRPDFARTDRGYYYVVLAVAVFCAIIILAIGRSRLGRLMRGLADSPVALDAHGTDTRIVRLYVFCISAFIAAVGGALLAGVTQSVTGDPSGPYSYFTSAVLVAVLAVCGRRTLLSPIVAAVLFEIIKVYRPFNEAWFTSYEGLLFGVAALAVAVGPGIGKLHVSKRSQERAWRLNRAQTRETILKARTVS